MSTSAEDVIAMMNNMTPTELAAAKAQTERWRPKVDLLPEEEVRRRFPGAIEALKGRARFEGFYLDGNRLRARLLTSNYLKHDPIWAGWYEG